MKELNAALKGAGLRATRPRLLILKELRGADQPLSAEQIFRKLHRARRGDFDLVTVYRNLTAFCESGLAAAVDVGIGRTLYEFTGDHKHHHHHVVCRQCHTIEHISVCGIDTQVRQLMRMGYRELTHRLEFFGVCRDCAG